MKRKYELLESGCPTGLCVRLADAATDEQIFAALQGVRWRGFRPDLEVSDLIDYLGYALVDGKGRQVAELLLLEE